VETARHFVANEPWEYAFDRPRIATKAEWRAAVLRFDVNSVGNFRRDLRKGKERASLFLAASVFSRRVVQVMILPRKAPLA
jgi:hypothetical protein